MEVGPFGSVARCNTITAGGLPGDVVRHRADFTVAATADGCTTSGVVRAGRTRQWDVSKERS
jgi:hypothetical protein